MSQAKSGTGRSAGTRWRLRRLADATGRFAMVAVDQRPPIEQVVRAARGEDAHRREDVSAIKRLLIEELGDLSTAVLADPLIAYPDAVDALPSDRGLIVTLEHAVYDEGPGGRRSEAIPDWTVEKIARMGGDGVKVLAWYRPDASPGVREHQERFVAEVGEACRRHDLPFVFELLVYPFAASAGTGDSYAEDSGKRAEAVIESVERFAAPEFHVDLFKLESPVPAAELPDPDGPGADVVQAHFDALDRAAGRPWVMLSAGATKDAFRHVLSYAYRAGASGFLAGRAIWWDAVQHFPDVEACRRALQADGRPYLSDLVAKTAAEARPWTEHPGAGPDPLVPELAGPDFARDYCGRPDTAQEMTA